MLHVYLLPILLRVNSLEFFISPYTPIADASETLKSEFEDILANVISCRLIGDVLVICANANAGLDRNDPTRNENISYASVGSHVIEYTNVVGRQLRYFSESHESPSLSTFSKKKYYGTWEHPRSKL